MKQDENEYIGWGETSVEDVLEQVLRIFFYLIALLSYLFLAYSLNWYTIIAMMLFKEEYTPQM
jgi:hypothetical protein